MKHIENNIDDDLASAFEDGGGATAPLNFPSLLQTQLQPMQFCTYQAFHWI